MDWPNKHYVWSRLGQIRKDLCDEPFLPKYNILRALEATPFEKVKAVVLGQDPYPTLGHANGLAFSVNPDVSPLPGSLRNIFQEYQDDLGYPAPSSGDLTPWAKRGVLLLNTALTVAPGQPGSHSHLWEDVTENILRTLERDRDGLVFVLWGRQAQSFLPIVLPSCKNQRHYAVLSPHPSPLSAHKGFFGSRPFSKVNSFLSEPIDWRLP